MYRPYFVFLLFFLIANLTSFSRSSNGNKRLNIQFNNDTFMDEISKEAIRKMHDELDTDEDGNVSIDEGAVFMAKQKELQTEKDTNLAGFKTDVDGRISEQEFWQSWIQSEAHNWTNADMLRWLKYEVELPQYCLIFQTLNVSGSSFPILAWNGSIVTILVEGSKENKLKLMLIAKQVVLFGPSKPKTSFFKDALLTISLLMALSGMFYGVHVKRDSNRTIENIQEKMKLLQSSMDTMLAETEIDKIWTRDITHNNDDDRSGGSHSGESEDSVIGMSVGEGEFGSVRLAEIMKELDATKEALRNAEKKLQRKASEIPTGLYDCLKATYDVESKLFEMKRKRVQEDLEMTKAQFQKIEKNRSSLLGILQVVHSRQMDRFDSKMQETRDEFVELQSIMKERKKRWTTIESLCKFRIKSSKTPRTKGTPEEDMLSSLDTMSIVSVNSSSAMPRHRKSKRPSVCTVQDEDLDSVSMLNFNSGAQRKSPNPTRKFGTMPSNTSVPANLSSHADPKKQRKGSQPTKETKTIVHSQSAKELPSHLKIPESGNQTFPKRSPVAKRRAQLPDFTENGDAAKSENDDAAKSNGNSPVTEKSETTNSTERLTASKRSPSVQSLPAVKDNGVRLASPPKQRTETNGSLDSASLSSAENVSVIGVDKGRKTNFIKRTFFQRKNKEKTGK